MNKKNNVFVSGNEAVALGVRLVSPHFIAAYPITPQTVVVERLAEMVEEGSLTTEFMHVESEHSALSAAMGASAVGARTFTATSSQGLLYMAECLHYASGGRFPIVMMNANRSVALPWSIYGDQRDSLSLLDSGWLQVYVEDAQESLDMIIQAYAIAEDSRVLTPIMVNLDGFVLTHTYELVEVPEVEQVRAFLPNYSTPYAFDFAAPKNMAFSSSPANNMEFKFQQHQAALAAKIVIGEVDRSFAEQFGRSYGGMLEAYRCTDAEYILVTLGSITGTARIVVDELRQQGRKVGVCKLRFLRPFPEEELAAAVIHGKAIGVLEKNISFGYEGTVYTNVNSALIKTGKAPLTLNFVAGLGGRDISKQDIVGMFDLLESGYLDKQSGVAATNCNTLNAVHFINLQVETDVQVENGTICEAGGDTYE